MGTTWIVCLFLFRFPKLYLKAFQATASLHAYECEVHSCLSRLWLRPCLSAFFFFFLPWPWTSMQLPFVRFVHSSVSEANDGFIFANRNNQCTLQHYIYNAQNTQHCLKCKNSSDFIILKDRLCLVATQLKLITEECFNRVWDSLIHSSWNVAL